MLALEYSKSCGSLSICTILYSKKMYLAAFDKKEGRKKRKEGNIIYHSFIMELHTLKKIKILFQKICRAER